MMKNLTDMNLINMVFTDICVALGYENEIDTNVNEIGEFLIDMGFDMDTVYNFIDEIIYDL